MGIEKRQKTAVSALKRVAENHSVYDENFRKNYFGYEVADRHMTNKQTPCEFSLIVFHIV